MKNQVKSKYVPCELNVVKFQAEKEFAGNSPSFVNTVGTSWLMEDTNGAYQNEKYEQDILDWSDQHNPLN